MDRFFANRKLVIIVAVVAALIILSGVFVFVKKHRAASTNSSITSIPLIKPQTGSDQVASLVAAVGKLIDLPQGEDPTVATITDINKLADQPLFSKGANGDKVLIYPKAKKMIIYDPQANRVVDLETINIGSSSATLASPSPSPSPAAVAATTVVAAKFAVLNGTATAGLAAKTATTISQKFPQAQIVSKDNAQTQSYQKTLVIPVDDTGKAQGAAVAAGLGAQLQAALPAGESAPTGVDIVVIAGADLVK